MDDEYDFIEKSSLKFKGEHKKKKKKKGPKVNRETKPQLGEGSSDQGERSEDAQDHGGWWKVEKYDHIKDDVAIEFLPGCYAKALGNGNIILGNPHPPGEGPDEEEIFTAVCAATDQIAFKSGFGRYLSVNNRKRLIGLSEAIGEQETFLPVFEDGKLALCAFNDRFLSLDDESDERPIVAQADKAGPYEFIRIRVNNDPLQFMVKQNRQDDKGTLYEAELSRLQRQLGHKDKNPLPQEDKRLLKKARVEGHLHEVLLDKRTRSKSDKYCK